MRGQIEEKKKQKNYKEGIQDGRIWYRYLKPKKTPWKNQEGWSGWPGKREKSTVKDIRRETMKNIELTTDSIDEDDPSNDQPIDLPTYLPPVYVLIRSLFWVKSLLNRWDSRKNQKTEKGSETVGIR